MADVITRLKVESTEYDSKIKRASQGLLQMEQACRKVGGTLAILEQDEKEFVRSLGQMETVSKDARGRINELTKAFTDLTVQYNRLTEEEKQGDFGKALSASLGELRTRIQDSKQELADINKEINGGGGLTGALDNLAGKFGLNIQQLAGWGAAIAAAKAALDVARDAFFASEANIDEWGRTVESSKMLYEGFLNALNTGDISGFLSNINRIVNAATEAYNALDYLNTMKTINAPGTSERQAEIARLQGMLRTGRAMDSLTGGRQYAADGSVLTDAQKKAVSDDLKNLLKDSRSIAESEIKAATAAIDALYEEQAAVLGMTADEFRKGTRNMDEFNKALEGAQRYRQYEREHTTTTTMSTSVGVLSSTARDKTANPYEQYRAWRDFKDDGPMFQQIVQEIQKRDQAVQQFYGIVNQSYRGINRAEGVRAGGGSGSKTTPMEKASDIARKAEQDYAEAMKLAAVQVEAGTATEADFKKRELQEQERLFKAYGNAYNVYADTKFMEAQDAAAKRIVELGGTVTELVEEQKKSLQAARELEQAEKKLATAQQMMAEALSANDLKAYMTAARQANAAQTDVNRLNPDTDKKTGVELPVNITYTDSNLAAFTTSLKDKLAQADVGSSLYNSIAAQLADTTALGNLMQTAVKNGMDAAQFNPQELWSKVFGENPGDYIDTEVWEGIADEISKIIKKKIKINANTGAVSVDGDGDTGKSKFSQSTNDLSKITGSVGSIASGIQQMGIDLPEGLTRVIGVLQGITTILTAIQAMTSISSIPFFSAGGIVQKMAAGGIAHAAGGWIVPGNYGYDAVPTMLTSGELVLNRSQQGNLASLINENERGAQGGGTPYVSGEQIYLGLNNYLRRSGRGELITSR